MSARTVMLMSALSEGKADLGVFTRLPYAADIQAYPFRSDKLVVNMPALNQASKIMMSSGDEVGTVGGVASNRIKGEVQFMNGSMTVMVGS
ncbi:hypothetical protein QWA_18604 [Alcaligenes faecalis subsp. faecalis NCIB 8687]|nr:hypothetical protein QWA_18604 [Alcaligenes faecalis subsp. faecalis NCIB 8687]